MENLVIFLLLPLAILLSCGGGKYAIIVNSTKCFKFAKAGKELCGWRIRRM